MDIFADLASRYPDGYTCFNRFGKRVPEPAIYEHKTGRSVNVNGINHFYSNTGYISVGHTSGGTHRSPEEFTQLHKEYAEIRQQRKEAHKRRVALETDARYNRGLARIANPLPDTKRRKAKNKPRGATCGLHT